MSLSRKNEEVVAIGVDYRWVECYNERRLVVRDAAITILWGSQRVGGSVVKYSRHGRISEAPTGTQLECQARGWKKIK